MRNKKIFVLKIVWRKSIALLHRLTQAVQRANLRRTAGDPTWVLLPKWVILYTAQGQSRSKIFLSQNPIFSIRKFVTALEVKT